MNIYKDTNVNYSINIIKNMNIVIIQRDSNSTVNDTLCREINFVISSCINPLITYSLHLVRNI